MPAMLGETTTDCIDMAHMPAQAVALITRLQQHVQAQAREIAWTQAKLEKVSFELARLKRWKFGTKTEALTAQQRVLFQEALAEDEASLQVQLAALQRDLPRRPRPRRRHHAVHVVRHCLLTWSAWSIATNRRTPPAAAARP